MTVNKIPSRRGLLVEHFDNNQNVSSSDQVVGTIVGMVVAVDRIRFFEGNPRRSPNECYAAIKESIREIGLDTPLPISHRPTDEPGHYIIYKGGNTRLRALQELWEETHDERFFRVRCEFHPFISDIDALISHLRENDLRGNMTLIDRALAVQAAKATLEQELGEVLSQRQLQAALEQRGFPISQGMISKLEYAVKLNISIPIALSCGMGKLQIERLTKLEKAALKVWQCHSPSNGTEQQFRETVFLPALASSDAEDWLYERAETLVKEKLVAALPSSVDRTQVLTGFSQAMDGKALIDYPQLEFVSSPIANVLPEPYPDYPDPEPVDAPLNQYDLLASHTMATDNIHYHNEDGNVIEQKEVIVGGNGRWLVKLKHLRIRNYEIASKLTDSSPIPQASNAIVSLETGYGFFVVDVFNPDFMAQLIAKTLGDEACSDTEKADAERDHMHASNLWWLLAELCGLFPDQHEPWMTAPDSVRAAQIDADSYIRDEDLLHKVHTVVPISARLRTFWLAMPLTQLELIFELIRNTVAIVELVSDHRQYTDDASPWEIITRDY